MSGPRLDVVRDATGIVVRPEGSWNIEMATPPGSDAVAAIEGLARGDTLRYDTSGLTSWDSGFLALLLGLEQAAAAHEVVVDRSGLPDGARRLLDLAESSPAREDARRDTAKKPLLDRVGESTIEAAEYADASVEFLGETTQAVSRFFIGAPEISPQCGHFSAN